MITGIHEAAARNRGRVLHTPLRHSTWLSSASGGEVFLKLETLQPTFSYKIRGATNAVLKLVEAGNPPPIVTASAGNHGRAMAHAAASAGLPWARLAESAATPFVLARTSRRRTTSKDYRPAHAVEC